MSENKQQEHEFSSFALTSLTSSRYINPYRVTFAQNGVNRIWDGIQCHPSVSCILYNTDRKCIVLVKQFRPVVFVNQILEAAHEEAVEKAKSKQKDNETPVSTNPEPSQASLKNLDWSKVNPNNAFTYELCAGICDKSGKSLEETVQEEIMEECGYQVSLANIHRVKAFRMGVGLIGSIHTIFYADVSDAELVKGAGGGNVHEGEFIELFELKESEVRQFINDEPEGEDKSARLRNNSKPPGLLFALMWFLYEREAFLAEKRGK
jgi:UDP-sugar diphosphatase